MLFPMRDRKPPLGRLTAQFAKIVNITFGGGDPTMAALYRELVERRGWLPADQYGLTYGLARLTPGTNMLAFCAGVAWYLRGWAGAIAAVIAGTLPSAVLVVWLTIAYQVLKDNVLAAGAVRGTLAAAVGMMFAAAWKITAPRLRHGKWPRAVVLAGGSALLLVLAMPPIQVLALAAVVGSVWRGGAES
jgi:chromate transporter